MRTWLNNLPIRKKLWMFSVMTAITSGVIAMLLLSMIVWHVEHRAALRNTTIKASIIAENALPALLFQDVKTAEEVLAGFSRDKDILDARIVEANGHVFASFKRRHADGSPDTQAPAIHVSVPMATGSERLATLEITSDTTTVLKQIVAYVGAVGLAMALAMLGGSLLVVRLQRTITEPLAELARLMKQVTQGEDFSRRATGRRRDELGQLGDSFNLMIEHIEQRNALLGKELSERTHAENALRENEEKLNLFIECAPAGIAMFDREMRYIAASRRYLEDYRIADTCIIGRSHYDVLPGTPERLRDMHRRCLAGETLRCDEDPLPGPDGSQNWCRWEIRPWFAASGDIGGCILFSEDITARKRTQDELSAAKAEAEHANNAKSRFLAAASHDLRQPVQGLRLLLAVLERKYDKPPEVRKVAARMKEALGSTETMLARLMEFAALESGKVAVQRERFAVDELVRRVAEEHAAEAEAKGLRLRVRTFACSTDSDPVLIERIIRNLLVNAIRFTERGGILLGLRRCSGGIRIEVRDTGPGIPADKRETVFEEFCQLGNGARELAKGVGLGLTIVARTAQLLDHPLSLMSTEARGSLFAITVPAVPGRAVQDASRDDEDLHPFPRTRILVVEDNPIQAMALEMILGDLGHEVRMAQDAFGAFSVLNQGWTPHLIISDYRLPGGISGIDLVQHARGVTTQAIPAIVVTGDTQAGIAEAALAAGCTILHKPYVFADLLALLEGEFDRIQRHSLALQ